LVVSTTGRLNFQNPHFPPLVTELRYALAHPLRRHEILHHQQIKLFSKRQKVGKERVEMCFDGEMQDLLKMRMVNMGKDSEEVFVNMFGRVGKRVWELSAWS